MGNENMTAAPSGSFITGDGLLNIAANKQEQFVALCDEIGRPELANDPRFEKRDERKRRRGELKLLIEQALAQAPAVEWERRFNRRGIPAGRILTIPQILSEDQVIGRKLMTTFPESDGADRLTVVRGGFLVDGEPPVPSRRPPRLGEQTAEILAEIVSQQAIRVRA